MANYAVRRYKPAIVVRGVTTSITLEVVDPATGELVDLSAGVSWELTDAGGSSVASGSATVSTTTATAQISSSATTGLALSAFWTMTWQASGVGAFPEQAALVVSDAHCPITVADILAEAPELYGCEWRDADGAAVAWSTFIEAAYKEPVQPARRGQAMALEGRQRLGLPAFPGRVVPCDDLSEPGDRRQRPIR